MLYMHQTPHQITMPHPDLNLLIALDALLTEGSVARAGKRLGLSQSAMSRTLARLRETTGDPLMVRNGRGLVPTPRALELRDSVGRIVEEAEAALRPQRPLDLARLERTFMIRTREGFIEGFGVPLLAWTRRVAPGVRLHFIQKTNHDSAGLRDGSVDLETGVLSAVTAPELRSQALFQDRVVGVVRHDHPLAGRKVTLDDYLAGEHVMALGHAIDDGLETLGRRREIVAIVGGFATALAMARGSDLIASVPHNYTRALRDGMSTFELPLPTTAVTISLLWHPRQDADPAHRWLRQGVREVCAEVLRED